MTSLTTLLSGETVEARWAREYAHKLQIQELEQARLRDKDQRRELLADTSSTSQNKAEEEEESDWKRTLVMTLRQWAISVGLVSDRNYQDEET